MSFSVMAHKRTTILTFGPLLALTALFYSTSRLQSQEVSGLPPGITLPSKGGVYAVESQNGESKLTQLHASEVSLNTRAGSNFARSVVYAGPHTGIELKGLNANTHLKGSSLFFLVRLNDEDSELMRNRLSLFRLRQTEKNRLVSEFSRNFFGGQHKRQENVVEVTKTDIAGGNWVKLIPVKPLEAGEYGIVIVPKDPSVFADEVYDFDTDFAAAKPDETSKTKKTGP